LTKLRLNNSSPVRSDNLATASANRNTNTKRGPKIQDQVPNPQSPNPNRQTQILKVKEAKARARGLNFRCCQVFASMRDFIHEIRSGARSPLVGLAKSAQHVISPKKTKYKKKTKEIGVSCLCS